MLDAHCHVDLYEQPAAVADRAAAAGVFTIMVTNLPSAYDRSYPHVSPRKQIRLALGLHPLMAEQHRHEYELFRTRATKTFFIGEVGLDFSREGRQTADLQAESFQFVLRTIEGQPKFLSIHSRRAESQVLEMLRTVNRRGAVFHWYSGPIGVLRQAVADGHYFSVNSAMFKSDSGRKIVKEIPLDRLLTETDGPFVSVLGRPAEPPDVRDVEAAVASVWNTTPAAVQARIMENFRSIIGSEMQGSLAVVRR